MQDKTEAEKLKIVAKRKKELEDELQSLNIVDPKSVEYNHLLTSAWKKVDLSSDRKFTSAECQDAIISAAIDITINNNPNFVTRGKKAIQDSYASLFKKIGLHMHQKEITALNPTDIKQIELTRTEQFLLKSPGFLIKKEPTNGSYSFASPTLIDYFSTKAILDEELELPQSELPHDSAEKQKTLPVEREVAKAAVKHDEQLDVPQSTPPLPKPQKPDNAIIKAMEEAIKSLSSNAVAVQAKKKLLEEHCTKYEKSQSNESANQAIKDFVIVASSQRQNKLGSLFTSNFGETASAKAFFENIKQDAAVKDKVLHATGIPLESSATKTLEFKDFAKKIRESHESKAETFADKDDTQDFKP